MQATIVRSTPYQSDRRLVVIRLWPRSRSDDPVEIGVFTGDDPTSLAVCPAEHVDSDVASVTRHGWVRFIRANLAPETVGVRVRLPHGRRETLMVCEVRTPGVVELIGELD